jgi:hypothetical protein
MGLARAGRQLGFVEVIDVKMNQPIVCIETAEVFQMQVAAQPYARRSVQQRGQPRILACDEYDRVAGDTVQTQRRV